MASNVPKFASFRPKPKPNPETSKDTPKLESRERIQSKKQDGYEKRTASKGVEVNSNDLFFSDRRGDPEISRYQSLNRWTVPKFHRYGYGHVLGLSNSERIDRENSTDKTVSIKSITSRQQERPLSKRQTKTLNERELRLVYINKDQIQTDHEFISLSRTSKRRRSSSSSSDRADPPRVIYRDIDSTKRAEQALDPDLQYESDTQLGSIDSEVIRKNTELLRRTQANPDDIRNWKALIDHQEAVTKLERPSIELSASDHVHLAKSRVAIYQDAIKKAGKEHKGLIELYTGLLREATKVWDESQLITKWKEVLDKYPHSADLWSLYLDFAQSNIGRFKYEKCRAQFLECLERLSSDKQAMTGEKFMHIFLRLTLIIQYAGYQELALGIWQACLEFHLLRPKEGDETSREEFLRGFELFWESEVPRIGELRSKGWKNHGAEDEPPSSSLKLEKPHTSDHIFDSFQKHEAEAMTALRYPGRSSDDMSEDDAFHVVFFSDIEEYLKVMPPNISATIIVEGFLCFCGLPPLVQKLPQVWRSDPFMQRQIAHRPCPLEESINYAEMLQEIADCPIKQFHMTSQLLFEQSFSLQSINLSADFVRRLLTLITIENLSDEAVAEYLLAFELYHFPSEVHKTAKLLLKRRPSSLRLYTAYGLVEARRGNAHKAGQVFSMALSMQPDDTLLHTVESLELLLGWVWTALHKGAPKEALWRLVSPHGQTTTRSDPEEPPDDEKLLHTQKLLRETSERCLLSEDYRSAVASTGLLSMLAYLSGNLDVTVALSISKNLTAYFASHQLSQTPHAEVHAQNIGLLLKHHVTHAPIVKPALIRRALTPLIALFPENTLLLALYAANEARFSIDDRVRSIMQQTALRNSNTSTVASMTFAIHFETLRSEIAGSTSHSIRALYKHAVESTATHCPALWEAYLQFELADLQKEHRRRLQSDSSKKGERTHWDDRLKEAQERTKDVFFAGVKSLPWRKDFMMLAFAEAKGLFDERELWQLYRVMQEKELRLYNELDEEG